MSYNYIFFSISLVIGIIVIIHSIKGLLKLKKMVKTDATVVGRHSVHGYEYTVTRVEFNINGVVRECDLDYNSIFFRKGKKIKIYYNPDKYWDIDCIQGNIFSLIFGFLFFLGGLFLFFIK